MSCNVERFYVMWRLPAMAGVIARYLHNIIADGSIDQVFPFAQPYEDEDSFVDLVSTAYPAGGGI